MQNRYLLTGGPGATERQYTLYRIDDVNNTVHQAADLFDWTGGREKLWVFQTDGTQFSVRLPVWYEERHLPGQITKLHVDYGWTTDGTGNPYIRRP